jgi:hypothetical protein
MAKQINVLAFGGLGGRTYSAGVKTILMALEQYRGPGKPIDYMTFEDYASWRNWSEAMAGWRDDTVLIGHSYGVAAMCGVARRLGMLGPKIPLAISLDPSQYVWMSFALWGSGGNSVPYRIGKATNFYQTNGLIGRQLLYRDDGGQKDILNLSQPHASHTSIDDDPKVQKLVIDEIKRLF